MSINFQAYPYKDVAAILPQRKKDLINSKVQVAQANLQSFNVNDGKVEKNRFPFIIALGVIVTLGGIFLALAAHQILPHGINAISSLGIGAKLFSYSTIGLGIAAVIKDVKSYPIHKKNSKADIYTDGVRAAHDNAEEAEMCVYFQHRIKADELFVVDNPLRKRIIIFYRQWDAEIQCASPMPPELRTYDNVPQEAFRTWSCQNKETVQGKAFVGLETLRQRTNEFESKNFVS